MGPRSIMGATHFEDCMAQSQNGTVEISPQKATSFMDLLRTAISLLAVEPLSSTTNNPEDYIQIPWDQVIM